MVLGKDETMSILEKAALLEKKNTAFALATIIESKGSTPRHIGKMIVLEDGSIEGTIGGGAVECYVIEASIKAIKERQSITVSYVLDQTKDQRMTMHCGGSVKVFIEVFNSRPELYFVGAGHIGLALAQMADLLGYPYSVVDDRPSYCTKERFPKAKNLYVNESIGQAVKEASFEKYAYVAIFTKDGDDMALKETLKSQVAYVGMIGSRSKIKRLFNKLGDEGVGESLLDQVHTPIGLPINAETPEEIAVSIMAEMIQVSRTGGSDD